MRVLGLMSGTSLDGLDFALDEIFEGKISATIMQSVDLMAETSFGQVIDYLNGEEFEKEILVPGTLITHENVRDYI